MHAPTASVLIAAWLAFTALSAPGHAQADMVLKHSIQPGESKKYDHTSGIVLSNGFWAKAGSDVTATINQTPGFFIDKTPLDTKNKQYTSNEGRTFVVAGCVPHKLKVKFIGSHWVACNDSGPQSAPEEHKAAPLDHLRCRRRVGRCPRRSSGTF